MVMLVVKSINSLDELKAQMATLTPEPETLKATA